MCDETTHRDKGDDASTTPMDRRALLTSRRQQNPSEAALARLEKLMSMTRDGSELQIRAQHLRLCDIH